MPNNRALKFRAFVSIGGKTLPKALNGGLVAGTIGRPPSATVNIAYGSLKLIEIKAPVRIWCELGKEELDLFEGELSHFGRVLNENFRGLKLNAQGYSHVWFRNPVYQVNELAPNGLSFGDGFRARSVGDPTGYTAGKRLSDLSNLLPSSGDLPAFIRSVLGRAAQNAGVGSQALSRVNVLSDNVVTQLFSSGDTARRLFTQLVEGQSPGIAPVMVFLQSILSLLYYEMVDQVGHTPAGRIIFKPQLIFTPVPEENVFIPSNYAGFEDNGSLLDAPTRMMFQTNAFLEPTQSGSFDATTLVRFAPRALQDRFDQIARGVRTPENLAQLVSTNLTSEELIRGIVPAYGAISSSEWVVASSRGGTAADSALGDIADYKLNLKKLEFRTATVHHKLAPRIKVGFPGFVVDGDEPLLSVKGLVSQVSHAFSVDGVSSHITLTHVRRLAEGMESSNPPWVSRGYASGGDYASIIGQSASGF